MRMSSDTEEALASCLDAVAEPTLWGAALQRLGESLGAESCTFCSKDLRQLSAVVMPMSIGHEEFAAAWRRNELHAPDPHFTLVPKRIRGAPSIILESHLTTEHERRTLPYFQETARPAGRDWWAISRFTAGSTSWCFPVYRGARRGPFTLEEAEHLALVGPRLAPILSMAEKFATFQVNSTLWGLEQARCPAFAIGMRGQVTNMNRLAEGLLGAGLQISAKKLACEHGPSNLSLQQLVANSLVSPKGDSVVADPIVIYGNGEPRYLVEAVPITAMLSGFFSAARLLLLVNPLKASADPGETLLRQAFGLSRAEARLARTLALGHDLQEAAELLGIKMPTVKSQLSAVFWKTNTRRQAELIGLVTRLGWRGGAAAQ